MKVSSLKKDKIVENILKECYWDYNITTNDIYNILNSDNEREHFKLFSKIIYNANDKLVALKLFTTKQLKLFFNDFRATYNIRYINKHIMVLRSLLLEEKNNIKGLEWKKI